MVCWICRLLDPIPSPVAHADFAALEWEPLLALVSRVCRFACGPRRRFSTLHPSTDEEWITRQHQLTGEVRLLLEEQVSIPLGGLFDPTQLADKAQIPGAALEAGELQAVARLANDVASWQSLLQAPPARLVGKLPGLSALSSTLDGEPAPAGGIHRAQDSAGWLAGRRCIARAGPHSPRAGAPAAPDRRVASRRSAQAVVRRCNAGRSHHDSRRPLRDSRAQRVEAAHRGVVHGASSSGQTVYVEPLETIEQNNELVRLFEEEQAEIHRIFVALTRQVAAMPGRWSKGRACWRWSTACWPAPGLPATTIASRRD